MEKKTRRSIFDDRRITLVASLLLAVLAWIIVAGFITPRTSRTLTNISIDYARGESNFKNLNLRIKTTDISVFADVDVSGPDTVIGGLDNTSVTVYPNYSQVKGPGVYEIPLTAEKITSGNYDISNYAVRGTSDTSVFLEFEEMEKKTFTISVRTDSLVAADGYSKGEATVAPVEVEVYGPKTEMAKVSRVVAVVEDEGERTESIIIPGVTLTLLDSDGNELDSSNFTFTPETVEVTVPILQEGMLNLTVDFAGMPVGFDEEWFKERMNLSPDTVRVAAQPSVYEHLDDPYVIGSLDLTAFRLENSGSYDPLPLTLPTGMINRDQVQQVRVTFNTEGLAEKSLDVANIEVRNAPHNTTITPVNNVVPNVTLVGPQEDIDAVLPENVVVEIDASSVAPGTSGQQSIAARVIVGTSNRVFAIYTYSVLCDVEAE